MPNSRPRSNESPASARKRSPSRTEWPVGAMSVCRATRHGRAIRSPGDAGRAIRRMRSSYGCASCGKPRSSAGARLRPATSKTGRVRRATSTGCPAVDVGTDHDGVHFAEAQALLHGIGEGLCHVKSHLRCQGFRHRVQDRRPPEPRHHWLSVTRLTANLTAPGETAYVLGAARAQRSRQKRAFRRRQ